MSVGRLFLLLCLLSGVVALAQTPDASTSTPPPLRFRTINVPFDPQDQVDELGKLIEDLELPPLVPVPRAEFEELLSRANAHQSNSIPKARIVDARYTAQFARDGTLVGTAQVNVVSSSDEPVQMPFHPCRLAIGEAKWKDNSAAKIEFSSKVGCFVSVDRSSTLQFPWSLQGKRSITSGWEFNIALPASSTTRLDLQLPPDQVLLASYGDVRKVKPDPDGDPKSLQRWVVDLPGRSETALRVVSADVLASESSRLILRDERFNYRVAQGELRVTVDLNLDIYEQPLQRLEIWTDKQFELLSAQVGDKEIELREVEETDNGVVVSLEFFEPIDGTGRVVQLSAVAPLITGRPWKLPRIKIPDVSWQEGRSIIVVPEPLSVRGVETSDTIISKMDPLPPPNEGEAIQLQHISPNASTTLTIDRSPVRISSTSASTVYVRGSGLTADFVADLSSQEGERFNVEMTLPRPWDIESIDAVDIDSEDAEDLVFDWSIASQRSGVRRVMVQLSKAIRPGRVIRLSARAFRPLPRNNIELGVGQWTVLGFRQVDRQRHAVAIHVDPPLKLEFPGSGEAESSELTPSDQERVVVDGATTTVVLENPSDILQARITQTAAQFRTENEIETTINDDTIDEVFRIRCLPDQSGMRRLLVHLSAQRGQTIQWSIDGESNALISARQLTAEEAKLAGIDEGELWEIALQRQWYDPFTLVGTYSAPRDEEHQTALIWVPGASEQTGRLELLSPTGIAVSLEGDSLLPIPAGVPTRTRYTNTQAKYRYEPRQSSGVVSISPGVQQKLAWVWKCHLTSRIGEHDASHTAVYQIENRGRNQVSVELPSSTTLREIRIDDQVFALAGDQLGTNVVPLPKGVRFPTLSISYTESLDLPKMIGPLQLAVPEIDIEVLSRRQTLWLSRNIALLDAALVNREAGWTRRLFGPLAADATISRPSNHWLEQDRRGIEAQTKFANGFAEMLIEAISRMQRDQERITWETLAADYEQSRLSFIGNLPSLLIDQFSLEKLGVAPESIVEVTEDVKSPGDLFKLLQQHKLSLIVAGDSLTLSSQASVASNADRFVKTQFSNVVLLVGDSSSFHRDLKPTSADKWKPGLPVQPWKSVGGPSDAPPLNISMNSGWRTFDLELRDTTRVKLEVYRPSTLQSMSFALLFFTTGLVWWGGARKPALVMPFIAASGVLALVVPPFFVPLSSSLFLGVLVASILVILPTEQRSPRPRPAAQQSIAVPAVAKATIGIVLLTAASTFVLAQEANESEDKAKPPAKRHEWFPVIFPRDEEQQPIGDFVWMQREFHNRLVNRVETEAWYIQSATYHGELQDADGQLEVGEFSVVYQLNMAKTNAKIAIPLRDSQLQVDQEKSHFAQKMIDWDEQGLVFNAHVDEPGIYELKLVFRPTTRKQQADQVVRLSIPEIPQSRLILTSPQTVEISGAIGATVKQSDQITANLGATSELAIRWPANLKVDPLSTQIQVDELFWLKVSPGSVTIDAQLQFTVPDRRSMDEITMSLDRRWEMRLRPDQPIGEPQTTVDGARQTVRVPLKKPVASDEFTLLATFVLSGASGIGQIQLPDLRVAADQYGRRWVAASVSPSLEYEVVDESNTKTISVKDEFLPQWQGENPETNPKTARELPRDPSYWTLSTRPVATVTTATERTTLNVGETTSSVRYQAQFATTQGYHYVHKFRVPAGLRVREVMMERESVERPVRWSSSSNRTITVFLNQRTTDRKQLTIEGEIKNPADGTLSLTPVTCLTATVESSAIDVFRQPQVLVRYDTHDGFQIDENALENDSENDFPNGTAHHIASFTRNDDSDDTTSLALQVMPNDPAVYCQMITQIDRTDGAWQADVLVRLFVTGGVVDELSIGVSDSLRDPVVEPNSIAKFTEAGEGAIRRILIRPSDPIDGELRFKLRGTLRGPQIQCPNIYPIGFEENPKFRLSRYLVLPRRTEDRQIRWSLSGMVPAQLPENEQARFTSPNEADVYRVVRHQFNAEVRELQKPNDEQKLQLVDIQVALRSDNSLYGLATFDFPRARGKSCVLQLPNGYKLVHVSVAGLPAIAKPIDDTQWRLQLSAPELPQRIEVLFSATRPALTIEAPMIVEMPVESIVWSIYTPQEMGDQLFAQSVKPYDLFARDLDRYRSTSALLENAESEINHLSLEQGEEYYQNWLNRIVALRRTITQSHPEREAASDLPSIDEDQASLAERLDFTRVRMDAVSNSRYLAEPTDLFVHTARRTSNLHLANRAESLALNLDSHPLASRSPRLFHAFLFLIGCAIVGYAARRGPVTEWLVQSPYAIGVVIGMVCWLLLAPSVVGLGIAAVCMLASIKSSWSPRIN